MSISVDRTNEVTRVEFKPFCQEGQIGRGGGGNQERDPMIVKNFGVFLNISKTPLYICFLWTGGSLRWSHL